MASSSSRGESSRKQDESCGRRAPELNRVGELGRYDSVDISPYSSAASATLSDSPQATRSRKCWGRSSTARLSGWRSR